MKKKMETRKKRTKKSPQVVFDSFELLNDAIEKAIRVHVNGKIDKLNDQVGEVIEKMDNVKIAHDAQVELMKPVMEQFNETTGFKKVIANYAKIVVGLVAFIGATIFLLDFARDVLTHPQQNMTPVPTNQQ